MKINGYEIVPTANLSGANLSRANLSEADLREANLRRADLSDADLRGANLSGANLSRANLRGAKGIIIGPQRSDGYLFYLTQTDAGCHVRAGCRDFANFDEAREHWTATRKGTSLGDETFAILDYLETRAKALDW